MAEEILKSQAKEKIQAALSELTKEQAVKLLLE